MTPPSTRLGEEGRAEVRCIRGVMRARGGLGRQAGWPRSSRLSLWTASVSEQDTERSLLGTSQADPKMGSQRPDHEAVPRERGLLSASAREGRTEEEEER